MQQDHRQPKGFSIFFLTEMWERYGFYIVQTLLVFYLLNILHLDDNQAYIIVGSFTALAYINSVFGGLVADRLIGYDRTLIIGGVLLFFGYATLAFAHLFGLIALAIGLASVTVGTGFLKPNVSSMLSLIYNKEDGRKEAGYTLYYVGIYVGALGGSLLGGYLNTWFGHGAAFGTAALGILIALFIFIRGIKKHKLHDNRHAGISASQKAKTALSVIALLAISFFVLKSEFLSILYFIFIAIFCIGFILYCIVTHHGVQRNKLIAFLILVLLSVLYWAVYFQQFFSISLCTERACRLSIPSSSVPAIESLGVIIFGPLVNWVWFKFQDKGRDISIPTKFSLGFLFNSLCFLLLAGGLWYAGKVDSYLSIWFIVVAYLLVAIGELCISPTSLSMVTSLVPERLTSAMMGISLLSIGFGGKLAGLLASDAALSKVDSSLSSIRHTYMSSFFNYFMISLLTYIVAVLLIKYVSKLISAKG